MLGRVKGLKNIMDHLLFVRKAYIVPNFRPLVPFLHVKKFVVGGWVLKWILVLSLDPSLTNIKTGFR